MQGYSLEDVANGIDEIMIRQPLGVTAAMTPFNLTAMIPLWFQPYAIARGNTFILKPSERVPLTASCLVELLDETGWPKAVVNLVVGCKPAVAALLIHPDMKAINFIGSTSVARYMCAVGAAHGRRAQCKGDAKNYVANMPDADLEMAAKIVSDSTFDCAGKPCLTVSAAITGEAAKPFTNSISTLASNLNMGKGFDQGVEMRPVVSHASKNRIESLIGKGIQHGPNAVLGGRNAVVGGGKIGYVRPATLAGRRSRRRADVGPGPVVTLQSASARDQAIAILSKSAYGNAASIFTTRGNAVRKFPTKCAGKYWGEHRRGRRTVA